MDYSRNATYFTDFTPAGGCSGCLGTLLLLCGLLLALGGGVAWYNGDGEGITEAGVGIALFVIASIILRISHSRMEGSKDTRISGGEYDASIMRYVGNLSRTRALQKLGVDASEVREIAPMILGGYEFEGADKVKQGDDGIWRSNIYKTVMLFFARSDMHCYTIKFKTTEDRILKEATDVYFYEDIVSASTESVSDIMKIGEKVFTINSEAFKLTTRGGTSIKVNVLNSRHGQESVNAIRALLREKKQA